MEINDWQDQFFESIQGIRRAEPPEGLFKKIWQRIKKSEEEENRPIWQLPVIRLTIAACFLLFCLNALILIDHYRQKRNAEEQFNTANENPLFDNFQLYEQ